MLKRDINCEKEITTEASNTINWEKDGWGFYGRVVCPTKIKHLKTCLYRHGSTAVPCHGTLQRRDEFLKNEKATAIKKKYTFICTMKLTKRLLCARPWAKEERDESGIVLSQPAAAGGDVNGTQSNKVANRLLGVDA